MVANNKKFELHWLTGKVEIGRGRTIGEAFTKLGYGNGALKALDYYTEITEEKDSPMILDGNGQWKIRNNINLEVGQIVSSVSRQITVPNWHKQWKNKEEGFVRIGDVPIIRLSLVGVNWYINTNSYRQSGLICFVSEKYLGVAILSVKIVAIQEKSVVAEPIEWIEVNPLLDTSYIGTEAQYLFDVYLERIQEKFDRSKDFDKQDTSSSEVRAVWHNKK